MRVVGIIPARYQSSRFPGKPLIDLKGKSMIHRVYDGVRASSRFSEVIVATDDQRIFDHVIGFGGKVQMTKDHPTGTDRCAEIAMGLEADVIVNIQGDEPLVNIEQLEPLVDSFNDPRVNIATLGKNCEFSDDILDENRIKIVLDAQNNALYFSRSVIPNSHRSSDNIKINYVRHIGVYAFRKETLLELTALPVSDLEQRESLEQLRWLYHGYSIRVVPTDIETPNIDVPGDVQKVLDLL